MILIADSGSTKCSWAICDDSGTIIDRCSTIGFNPYFISSSAILNKLEASDLTEIKESVSKVYFYVNPLGIHIIIYTTYAHRL